MDYEFSDIPLQTQGKKQRLFFRRSLKTAYGQLIALVFVPICVLALVGMSLVLKETNRSAKAQQRYEAMIILHKFKPIYREVALNTDKPLTSQMLQDFSQILQMPNLKRAAIIKRVVGDKKNLKEQDNTNYVTIASAGRVKAWPSMKTANIFHKHYLAKDNIYALRARGNENKAYWLIIEMEETSLVVSGYQVWLVVAITGLLTLLMLLLFLNSYSKRWITPLYEMRLHLQQTTEENLYKPMHVVSSGELNLLQRDLVFMLRRLHLSFQDLKEHSAQTEIDLRNAYDNMEITNISMRTARDAAVQASKSKSAFLANISHELRTPLNSIDGFINLLARKKNLTSEQNTYVQTIKKSSAHLLALVNDVLDFSKIEAGKLVLEQQETDLYTAVYDVVDMLTPLASEKQIDLVVYYYSDVPTRVITDELRIKQVLTNLVGNALKFTDSGEVIVRVSLDEVVVYNDDTQGGMQIQENIVISVQDTGKGVHKGARQSLFKNFSQGDPSVTRQFGGTGLGLAISKQLISLLDGNIGYKDNVTENISKRGSTFWFSLPITSKLKQNPDLVLEQPAKVMAYIVNKASMQVVTGLCKSLGAQFTQKSSNAGLIDELSNNPHVYDWLIVDGKHDLEVLLSGIKKTGFTGNVGVLDYQVNINVDLIAQYQDQYKIHEMYQPLGKRRLHATLEQKVLQEKTEVPQLFTGRRILAVDDHKPNLMVLDALLSEFGVDVTTVDNGADALDIYNNSLTADKPFDLVFMDIQMPNISGFEVTKQIRQIEFNYQKTHKDFNAVPVVALTAHSLADEREQILNAGMNDYASKPVSHAKLEQVLKKWLLGNIEDNANTKVNEALEPQNSLKVFDWQDALDRAANKSDLAIDVLVMLIQSLPQEKQALQKAWDDNDLIVFRELTHKLKGGCRYTGVPRLRSIVEQLDQQALARTDDPLDEAKQELAAGYVDCISAIDELIALDIEQIKQQYL